MVISTHTPLARRDEKDARGGTRYQISTHTPLARRDGYWVLYQQHRDNFYSHASCEARHQNLKDPLETPNFYSHASCEARQLQTIKKFCVNTFLLTRLLRGATEQNIVFCNEDLISTHTPLARRDRYI